MLDMSAGNPSDTPMTTAVAMYDCDAAKSSFNPAFPAEPIPTTTGPHDFPITTTTRAAFSVCVWLSKDPIGERGGGDVYLFVRNSTVNLVDVDGRFIFPVIVDLPPGSFPYPQYPKEDCEKLSAFIEDQEKMKNVYEKALGTCEKPEFPEGAKKIADISMVGCFKIADPGKRAMCFAHEMSHIVHIPWTLIKIMIAKCKCDRLDEIYKDEIRAYDAGISEGQLLYRRHCSGGSPSN